MENLILMTDSYKASHFLQYPPGTSGMFSYLESRGGRYTSLPFFGLQYILKRYLANGITSFDVDEAAHFFEAHGEPFPTAAWRKIVNRGYLPVRIRAVKEGTVVPVNNCLVTVESTDPDSFWIVNWIEALLHRVWYPTTVAAISHGIKKDVLKYLQKTGDPAGLPFKLHDFGGRGVSSSESAAIGGAAHLTQFMGSDTVEGIMMARRFYGAEMAGYSIPAAEHSTITSWGRSGEVDAYRNMIRQFGKPGKLFAVVSDSYDIFNAVDHLWGEQLRQDVIDSQSLLVVRPDSGDPVYVVNTVAHKLAEKFGFTVNEKGYKVLNNVRIIQGDGVNPESIVSICESLTQSRFSIDNVAFGMGGALLQKVDRDTQKFAYKCSSVQINGEWKDVFKDPITDAGKKSKKGRVDLFKSNVTGYYTEVSPLTSAVDSQLDTVFEDGDILREQTLDEIRRLSDEDL